MSEPGSKSFRQWFRDSKVVNKEGDPLVVYHGTAADFSEFKPTPSRRARFGIPDEHVESPAFFFSESRAVAEAFAQRDRGTPRVISAYLSIQNPFDFTRPHARVASHLRGLDIAEIVDEEDDLWSVLDSIDAVERLLSAGYDGARVRERTTAQQLGLEHDPRASRSWAVFSSSQVRQVVTQNRRRTSRRGSRRR